MPLFRVATKIIAVIGVIVIAAGVAPIEARQDEEPIFVRWMSPRNAKDQTILNYWERAKEDKLEAEALIDLGTMVFRRGFPNDALDIYEMVLDKNKKHPEAWYRIGLIEHRKGHLRKARHAYEKCLKYRSGHGWCNFYLGYLEEGRGNAKGAMEHYTTAFKHAPELADPEVNPQLLYSKLYVGAFVKHRQEMRFERSMPMPILEPMRVQKTTQRMKRELGLPEQASSAPAEDTEVSAESPVVEHRPEVHRETVAKNDDPSSGKSSSARQQAEEARAKATTDPKHEESPYGLPEPKPTPPPNAKGGELDSKTLPQRRRPVRRRKTPLPKPKPAPTEQGSEKPENPDNPQGG